MKKIVISLPVHEEPMCVESLIRNIKKFVPNSAVVMHASGSSYNGFVQAIGAICDRHRGFAFMNQHHYQTFSGNDAGFVTGLSTVHGSNFKHMSSIMDFDTFALDTSNDFFVRKGIEDLFERYSCAFFPSHCPPEHFIYKDILANMQKVTEIKEVIKGPQEGSFYPKEVFAEVVKKVDQISTFLNCEEIYIPTLAFNMFPELCDKTSAMHYVHHNGSHSSASKEDVIRIREGHSPHQYAVKRIPRRPNDPTRIWVEELTKND